MPPVKKEPNFKLGINLEDLDRIDPIMRQRLLHKRLDLENPVRIATNSLEVAIPFVCNLRDAATICDIIRSEDRKAGDAPTRIYLKNGTRDWKRTSPNTLFGVQVKGQLHLNPQVFNVPIEHTPPEREALF